MQLEASMSEVRAAIAEHSQVLKELKVKEQRLQDEIFTCKQRVSVSPTCVFFLHPPPPPLNENSSLHLSRPLDLSTSRPLDLSTSRPLDLSTSLDFQLLAHTQQHCAALHFPGPHHPWQGY